MNNIDIALICKAMSDSNRLQILHMLLDGEKCACEILNSFEITQPTLSHHMKILSESGLVKSRKEGKWSYYTINCEVMKSFKNYIGSMTCKNQKEV